MTPEDPKATAKLEDPQKPIEVKKDIIEDKLAELKDNPVFVQELTAQLTAYAADTALGNPIKSSEIPIILIQTNTARFGYTF